MAGWSSLAQDFVVAFYYTDTHERAGESIWDPKLRAALEDVAAERDQTLDAMLRELAKKKSLAAHGSKVGETEQPVRVGDEIIDAEFTDIDDGKENKKPA